MTIKIALAGNPNCGKTTLFNQLTGSNQYVGNWPGVTVEKKEGRLRGRKDVVIQDLPGIYSLSPYTLEEVVARDYLVGEKPDAILNIVDGTNIERNLYLTTQLIELGLPVVVAVNMMDLVRRNGDEIDLEKLGQALGCQVVSMSALKGEGGMAAAEKAVEAAVAGRAGELPHVFTGSVEHAVAHIEESVSGMVDAGYLRWYAIKLFERDEKVMESLRISPELADHLEAHIADCEAEARPREHDYKPALCLYPRCGEPGGEEKGRCPQSHRLRQDRPHRHQPGAGPANLCRHYVFDLRHCHGRLERLHRHPGYGLGQ